MSMTTMLVHITAGDDSAQRLETAITLARDHAARLIGLFVTPRTDIPAYAQAFVGNEFIQAQRQAATEEADTAEAAFRDRVTEDDIAAEWRAEIGDAHHLVPLHARYADLAMVGLGGNGSMFTHLSEAVILDAGRQVIVVPDACATRPIGTRIMVAWNGSRQAARAAHDALPLLKKAELVTVLTVNAEDDSHLPGADIAALLAHHGIRVDVAETASSIGVLGAGTALMSWAGANDIDLMVMGAYGHSRAREWVIGGATRSVLDDAAIPVLMSH